MIKNDTSHFLIAMLSRISPRVIIKQVLELFEILKFICSHKFSLSKQE